VKLLDDIVRDVSTLSRGYHGDAKPRHFATTLSYDGSLVLALTRMREAAARHRVPLVGGVMRRLQVSLFGVEIANDARLGTAVLFLHPVGVVIGGDSKIGDDVVFLGCNTIGSNKSGGYPTIGNRVVIGAGARILGPVTIGDDAVIGANAVVVRDVPAGASAAGVPAVVRLREDRRDAADAASPAASPHPTNPAAAK
jgi:serine O-acetyltransferase